jgi:predicted nucleic acid-binding protein
LATFFIDSSALVKRYRNEGGSQRVAKLLAGANRPLIARLTAVEVSSALVRRARATGLSAETLRIAIEALDADLRDSIDLIELDDLVMEHAVAMTRKYGLRGADAIQLACLILAYRQMPDLQLVLLSADDELNAAAVAEGFSVENPNLHP